MTEVSIIIPTYNEEGIVEKSIKKTYNNLKKRKINAEIVVVDDSIDNTYKILKRLAKVYKNLKLIHRENERGVGSAIRVGIEKSSGKYVIIHMADNPKDVKYFSLIIEKLREGNDVVQTSFWIKGTKAVGYPFIKIIGNRLFNNLIRLIFMRFDLTVFTSVFKGIRKDAIKHLNLESTWFDIGIEISLKSIKRGYKIVEVPVDFEQRDVGKSKLSLTEQAPKYFMRMLKIWLTYW